MWVSMKIMEANFGFWGSSPKTPVCQVDASVIFKRFAGSLEADDDGGDGGGCGWLLPQSRRCLSARLVFDT